MAEYCTICFDEDISTGYDFNLYEIAKKLKVGYTKTFLCEGCNRRAISKDEHGELELGRDNGSMFLWASLNIYSLKI